jgi:hypothetical protein
MLCLGSTQPCHITCHAILLATTLCKQGLLRCGGELQCHRRSAVGSSCLQGHAQGITGFTSRHAVILTSHHPPKQDQQNRLHREKQPKCSRPTNKCCHGAVVYVARHDMVPATAKVPSRPADHTADTLHSGSEAHSTSCLLSPCQRPTSAQGCTAAKAQAEVGQSTRGSAVLRICQPRQWCTITTGCLAVVSSCSVDILPQCTLCTHTHPPTLPHPHSRICGPHKTTSDALRAQCSAATHFSGRWYQACRQWWLQATEQLLTHLCCSCPCACLQVIASTSRCKTRVHPPGHTSNNSIPGSM